jgi:hypothetical protein
VQGLPVPHRAVLVRGNAVTYSAHYSVPDAGGVGNLNQWYEQQFVTGRPWREWSACRSPISIPRGGQTWRWQKRGTEVRGLTLYTSEVYGRVGIVISVSGPVPPTLPCP